MRVPGLQFLVHRLQLNVLFVTLVHGRRWGQHCVRIVHEEHGLVFLVQLTYRSAYHAILVHGRLSLDHQFQPNAESATREHGHQLVQLHVLHVHRVRGRMCQDPARYHSAYLVLLAFGRRLSEQYPSRNVQLAMPVRGRVLMGRQLLVSARFVLLGIGLG